MFRFIVDLIFIESYFIYKNEKEGKKKKRKSYFYMIIELFKHQKEQALLLNVLNYY